MERGRFTLPGQAGMDKQIAQLADLWGADAIRDSDGTTLTDSLINMDLQVYSTLCMVRMDNQYAKDHEEYLQQIYLTSEPYVATDELLEINIMERFFNQQFRPNTAIDIKKYWQVMDRTTGHPISNEQWKYSNIDGQHIVAINVPAKWHKYSVSFLAQQIWEPVSMYNHLTNNWEEEHKMPIDPIYPQVQEHMLSCLDNWLQQHPKTDVVRFTTFFYCFDLIYDNFGKEKMVNWFGYLSCVSPRALELFEKQYGYTLSPEDFIDNFMYNTPFKNPSSRYSDWMEFIMKHVSDFACRCVQLVHKYDKKAIMFLGDHWAGTEPYGRFFDKIGLDAVVGAAGDGVTTRMIADIPVAETEARFYPYLFPDVFCSGGNPAQQAVYIWTKCRRAILRSPVQRMGYGGYLSLAVQFPDFIKRVEGIANQFRSIWDHTDGQKPYSAPFKVGVLNSWGKLRSWQTHQVAHSFWHQRCYSYLGALEALSGLPIELEFISFAQIRTTGIPSDIKVIINAGDAGTSWSGGNNWGDEKIVTELRKWVHEGGGFIGIGQPTAFLQGGSLFTLSDVLGVQMELGFTASNNKPHAQVEKSHFITQEIVEDVSYGEGMSMIYKSQDSTCILDFRGDNCNLTANQYGKGRSVYIAGLPYNSQNSRLLHRAICWVASREEEMKKSSSDNIFVECCVYPEIGKCCAVNNSEEKQTATLYACNRQLNVELDPMEIQWISIV